MELAELVAVATEVLGCSTQEALALLDAEVAEAALSRAGSSGAALVVELVLARPFARGNDRIAVLAGALAGRRLDPEDEVLALVTRLRAGAVTRADAISWLERVPTRGGRMDARTFAERFDAIVDELTSCLGTSNEQRVRVLVTALLAQGHVLVDGTATKWASALSRAVGGAVGEVPSGADFAALIGTPALPSGAGPLFANVVSVPDVGGIL